MRDKLEKIIAAYEELEQKMSTGRPSSPTPRSTRIAKEHADQAALVAKAREYLQPSMTSGRKGDAHEASDAEKRRCSKRTSPITRPSFRP